MADVRRYRFDDLRRFASTLASAAGVAPPRASALATQLLWFDAADASLHGIARLDDILVRMDSKEIDPKSEPRVVHERGSTAVLDGLRGVPLLVLDRAAGLATEKARDTGVGLIRVKNIGPTGPAAGVAAEMAIGPVSALILGPDRRWAVALPSPEGLPVVFDPEIGRRDDESRSASVYDAMVAPWASILAPEEGWLVAAISVNAMESLSTFHERSAELLKRLDGASGRLLPGLWEQRRRDLRERGVAIESADWERLSRRASLEGITPPASIG